jgi:hypothetical protein
VTSALGVQFGESFNMLVWELARAYVFPRLQSIGDIYEGPADYVRTVIICRPPRCELAAWRSLTVNGQAEVPAGGQVKVPIPRG